MLTVSRGDHRMRILFFVTGLTKGGSEKQVYILARELFERKNIEIKVISLVDGYYGTELRKQGIPISSLNATRLTQFFKSLKFYKKAVETFKPDIVQTFLPHSNIIAKLMKPFVSHKHKLVCSIRVIGTQYLFYNMIERMTDCAADCVVVNSKSVESALQKKYFFSKRKTMVIHNGFDPKSLNSKSSEDYSTFVNNRKIILTVANMRKQKDYITNIRTARELRTMREDFLFLYAGDGIDRKKIERRISKYDLGEHVKLLGIRDDIGALLRVADVYFLPTLSEGQSNSLIDAMYYKVPTVTTDINENMTLVPSGIFCPRKNFRRMAKAINGILSGEKKLDLEGNSEFVQKNFLISSMIIKYIGLYEDLLKNVRN